MIFVLMVFVLAQFFLSETLSGRETALSAAGAGQRTGRRARARAQGEGRPGPGSRALDRGAARVAVGARKAGRTGADPRRARGSGGRSDGRFVNDIAALQALKAELEREAASLAQRSRAGRSGADRGAQGFGERARPTRAAQPADCGAARADRAAGGRARRLGEEGGRAAGADLRPRPAAERRARRQGAGAGALSLGVLRPPARGSRRPSRISASSATVSCSPPRCCSMSAPPNSAAAGRAQIIRVADDAEADRRAKSRSDIDWILQVEGHTDRVPISTPQFPSNWELSEARAMSVLRLADRKRHPAEATGGGRLRRISADRCRRQRGRLPPQPAHRTETDAALTAAPSPWPCSS